MNWIHQNRRSAVVVAATLSLPVLCLCYLLFSLLILRHEYQVEIDRLEPRIERLKGLLESEPVLQASVGEVSRKLESAVYPASAARPTVSAELQNSVRGLLVKAGLSVSNIQALPVVEGEDFDRVGLRLTMSGQLPEIDDAFIALSEHSPSVFVEGLDMQSISATRRGRRDKEQTVSVTLRLVALRAVR